MTKRKLIYKSYVFDFAILSADALDTHFSEGWDVWYSQGLSDDKVLITFAKEVEE